MQKEKATIDTDYGQFVFDDVKIVELKNLTQIEHVQDNVVKSFIIPTFKVKIIESEIYDDGKEYPY